MAMTRPQPLADHTNIIKRTGENFPKTALASIQLMCLIAKTNQVIRLFMYLMNWFFKNQVWFKIRLGSQNRKLQIQALCTTINLNCTFFIYCS